MNHFVAIAIAVERADDDDVHAERCAYGSDTRPAGGSLEAQIYKAKTGELDKTHWPARRIMQH